MKICLIKQSKEILKYLDESLPDFYKMNSTVWIDINRTK